MLGFRVDCPIRELEYAFAFFCSEIKTNCDQLRAFHWFFNSIPTSNKQLNLTFRFDNIGIVCYTYFGGSKIPSLSALIYLVLYGSV